MVKDKIYLITYINSNTTGDDTIEGYVEKKGDFDKWLREHNKRRREEGEIIEYKDEFDIKEVNKL